MYYRFPCGTFEELGPPWHVYLLRPMPCTPAGDQVATFKNKDKCDSAVAKLNDMGASLEEAFEIMHAELGISLEEGIELDIPK